MVRLKRQVRPEGRVRKIKDRTLYLGLRRRYHSNCFQLPFSYPVRFLLSSRLVATPSSDLSIQYPEYTYCKPHRRTAYLASHYQSPSILCRHSETSLQPAFPLLCSPSAVFNGEGQVKLQEFISCRCDPDAAVHVAIFRVFIVCPRESVGPSVERHQAGSAFGTVNYVESRRGKVMCSPSYNDQPSTVQ